MAEVNAAQMMDSKKWLDRTEYTKWEEEENYLCMIEAEDSWILNIVFPHEVVAAILNDILDKVC
jgi:hypothetical protein